MFQRISTLREGKIMAEYKYKVVFDGFDDTDELFDTEEAAEEYAWYLCGCERIGAETSHWSNPGDYDYDEDTWEASSYKIVKIKV